MLYNYVEVSDEEDRASITSTKKKRRPVMPMGIRRVEHKEEGITMTTAAEIEAQEKAGAVEEEESDEEGLFVGGPAGEDLSEPGQDEAAVPQPRSQIKREQGEEDEMELDAIPEGIKTPESPELKKKTLVGEQKPKKKSAALKDDEAEIMASDLERMVDLFTLQGDDTTIAEDGTTNNAALEGHMFLFQFPPVLPPLRAVPRDGTSTNPIKPEPDDDDVVMLNQPPVNIDLTQDTAADKVKKEGEGGEQGEENHDEEEGDELREGGFIGNLVVRKSGKVELSWGGQKLQLMPGTQTNFLSTAVLIEEADVKAGDVSQMAGVAYGMGKIQGSFASAPTWGDEEDWVVDPKELRLPE
jgi:DNA-directed RNA polymerase III subunit RPC4